MSPLPRTPAFDSTLAFLCEGYGFVSHHCRLLQTDAFRTRLLLRDVVCALGADAAEMFYGGARFTRHGAMPQTTQRLLQDRGSVQALDGEAHRHRKAMFLAFAGPDASKRLARLVADACRASIPAWARQGEITLHREMRRVLCQAACAWAGVPVTEPEASARTRELGAMIDQAGRFGPRAWGALLLRRRTERWARHLVAEVRAGRLRPPQGAALEAIAQHRDRDGALLSLREAGVELLNVLRPTVAIARFVTFAALALHRHPALRAGLQVPDAPELTWFAQEVRRYYPFFPVIGGRAREGFDWRGHRFERGAWVLLDLYGTNRDPRIWGDPETFRPERFRDRDGGAFGFVPQGGGAPLDDHRCPGEQATIEVLKEMTRLLAGAIAYEVPDQDLRIDLRAIPALPRSGFRMRRVRSA